MKRFIVIAAIAAALVGCGDREQECFEATGRDDCFAELRRADVAKIQAANPRVEYEIEAPSYSTAAAPGSYTNYYGSPQHGYWRDGSYHFSDPYSQAATSTNSFLIGAGLGGLTAYALTKAASRGSWMSSHPSGYKTETRVVKQYVTPKGSISKAEYERRKKQSKADRKKHNAAMDAKVKKAEADAKRAKEAAAKAKGQKIAAEKKAAEKKRRLEQSKADRAKNKAKPVNFNKPAKPAVKKKSNNKPEPAPKPKKRKKAKKKKK